MVHLSHHISKCFLPLWDGGVFLRLNLVTFICLSKKGTKQEPYHETPYKETSEANSSHRSNL